MKKIKHFCRLYKYTCAGCGKIRHRRHFARPGKTICPTCSKVTDEKTGSLFDNQNNMKTDIITRRRNWLATYGRTESDVLQDSKGEYVMVDGEEGFDHEYLPDDIYLPEIKNV